MSSLKTFIFLSFIISTYSNSLKANLHSPEWFTAIDQKDTIIKPPLKLLLDEKKSQFEKRADANTKKTYGEGIQSVLESGILKKAKQVGEKAPDFTLRNATGELVRLYDYVNKGYVILTWYRGGWCPYCNITLHQLQEELPEFEKLGAKLIALTPELPDQSLSTAEKNNLSFEVLSDVGNKVGKTYGVVFTLTDEVAKIYQEKFDLHGYNGDSSNELPLAATYIIRPDGTIIYAFLNADYRNRAEPSELTEVIRLDKK